MLISVFSVSGTYPGAWDAAREVIRPAVGSRDPLRPARLAGLAAGKEPSAQRERPAGDPGAGKSERAVRHAFILPCQRLPCKAESAERKVASRPWMHSSLSSSCMVGLPKDLRPDSRAIHRGVRYAATMSSIRLLLR